VENTLSPGTFFGKTQRRIDVAGLTFAESEYATENAIPSHEHVNAFFYLVVEGVCRETYRGGTRTATPHTLVFHPAGERHSNLWRGPDARAFHIEVSRERADSLRAQERIIDHSADFQNGMAPWLAGRLYREYRRESGASSLALEGLALEILAEVSRPRREPSESPAPKWLLRARDVLHDRFADRLSLGEIARAVDVHPVHLARIFRHRYGCSLGEYLRRVRVRAACGQLAGSERPLADIALGAGFSDQSHFTRVFRQRLHMTPGEFRRQFAGARGVPEDVSGVQDPGQSPP